MPWSIKRSCENLFPILGRQNVILLLFSSLALVSVILQRMGENVRATGQLVLTKERTLQMFAIGGDKLFQKQLLPNIFPDDN